MTNNFYPQDTGFIPGHTTPRLYRRAEQLWDALPEDLPESVYARILDATNECLAADDRIGLEVAYATATMLAVAA
jgi:hypothetical protein